MTVSRLLARPMLASMFVVGGAHALRDPRSLAPEAAPVADKLAEKAGDSLPVPQDAVSFVRANGAAQVLAGLALATGKAPRLSAAVLAASLVPTTYAGHRFWEASDKETRTQQTIHFFKNVSMLGGLIIAAGDTAGKPGVAWRARHGVRGARREARHLAGSARRDAAVLRAKVA